MEIISSCLYPELICHGKGHCSTPPHFIRDDKMTTRASSIMNNSSSSRASISINSIYFVLDTTGIIIRLHQIKVNRRFYSCDCPIFIEFLINFSVFQFFIESPALNAYSSNRRCRRRHCCFRYHFIYNVSDMCFLGCTVIFS